MGFGLSKPIPAASVRGEDHYLIVGVEGLDCIVIDQDGDMRPVTMTDLKTKWVYLTDLDVWYSTQTELEDLQGESDQVEPAGGAGAGDSGTGESEGSAPEGPRPGG